MENKEKTAAIIVAAGESRRMGGVDKPFADLKGKLIIARVLDAFQKCPAIDRIILVVNAGSLEKARALVAAGKWEKTTDILPGGARRQDSVAAGLSRLNDELWVLVHDGARPLVTPEIIERGLAAARETGAAVAAVPVTDTIKVVAAGEIVAGTPPRANLRAVQTPQVFRADIIAGAYRDLTEDATDDAALAERAGFKVKLYPGSYDNIKITTPADLALAGVLIKEDGD